MDCKESETDLLAWSFNFSPQHPALLQDQDGAQKNQNPDSGTTNPETKGKKIIFRSHFETSLKTHFVAS